MALKHVGRDAKTHRKVIVAYRVVPGEPDNCLIIKTESLDAASHDSLMTAVESNAGQNADEFAEAMFRTTLPDGAEYAYRFAKIRQTSKSTNC